MIVFSLYLRQALLCGGRCSGCEGNVVLDNPPFLSEFPKLQCGLTTNFAPRSFRAFRQRAS